MNEIMFTIPDGTPKEQIEHIKSIRELTLATAKFVEEEVDTTPFDDAIKKLEAVQNNGGS